MTDYQLENTDLPSEFGCEEVLRMEEWRLLDAENLGDASVNVSIDEAIFTAKIRREVPPTVRFWRNDRAIVVGYSQNVEAEVNLELCKEMNISVIRRISGGGAVYHDLGNLNYAIVLDNDHPLVRDLDIAESYSVFCSGIIEGLKEFGILAEFRPLSDVFIRDKKVSGSAQSRKRRVVLHHGTLLVDTDLDVLTRVLDAPQEILRDKKSTSVKKPVTRLKDELNCEISVAEVKEALKRGFERAFYVSLIPGKLTSVEEELAQTLYDDKYSRKEWNFWR